MVYDNLKAICKEKGLTFQQVEEMTGLGAGCISRWRNDKMSPKIKTLIRVANALDVPIEDLVKE